MGHMIPKVREHLAKAVVNLLIVVPVLLPVAAYGSGTDWPGFRGAAVDGRSTDTGVFPGSGFTLKTVWKKQLGSGYSSVSVAEGAVAAMFASGAKDYVAAFSAETGDEAWRVELGASYEGHDGSHTGPIATPLIAAGKVIALSARGRLLAVNLNDGKVAWSTELVAEHDAVKPHYGFSTSPMMMGDMLIVQVGSHEGSVAGFDPATGKKKWQVGDDTITYQSPIPYTLAGQDHVLSVGQKKLIGVDPRDGKIIWEHEHGGGGARGVSSLTPVPAGEGRLFLAHRDEDSSAIKVSTEGESISASTLWEDRSIRNSYNVPIYHDGHLFAYSSRFLTCVDAATGKSKWRSRQPGDGFLIFVDGHLVIATKKGGLHIVAASPSGFEEKASLPLFDDLVWSHPAFAAGRIYARSLGEIACVEIVDGTGSPDGDAVAETEDSSLPGEEFAAFLKRVNESQDKQAVVEAFLEGVKEFPLIEPPNVVHFLYHGDAEDVAVGSDMFGARQERAMTRIDGTRLFYYSTVLEPDARVNYMFIKDYADTIDPRNPRKAKSSVYGSEMEMSFGGNQLEMSWFGMPRWEKPHFHDEVPEDRRGKVESHKLTSEKLGRDIDLKIYLPPGYESSDERYPLLIVHNGEAAIQQGWFPTAFDNLAGRKTSSLIAVFVSAGRPTPMYGQMIVAELVPFIDKKFRTIPEPRMRANYGAGFAGLTALMTTFGHRDTFGAVACQSPFIFDSMMPMAKGAISRNSEDPPVVYMDWGKYDLRNPHEAWDLARTNREFEEFLREKGIAIRGGEVHDGTGWASWRNRTDDVVSTLFSRK